MDGRQFDAALRAIGAEVSRRRGLLAGLGALAAALVGASAEAAPDAECKPNRMACRGKGECCSGVCRNGWCAPKNGRGGKKKKKHTKNKNRNKGNGGKPKPGPRPAPCGSANAACRSTGDCCGGLACVDKICKACDVSCTSVDRAACGAALNEALGAGGSVRVCPGEYEGPFPLTADVEVIGSGSGANPKVDTILVGAEGLGSVVPVASSVTARLASLRITGGNGATSNSGGVYVNNAGADVTIDGCALVGNAGDYGGGASVYNGGLTIAGSEISGNSADYGGAIATASLSTIESTRITGNTAAVQGGGIFLNSGASTLGSGVTITGNTSNGGAGTGGGIYNYTTSATINNSATVSNNTPENCAGNGFTFTCS